ncbi:MAG TPA: phosphotransferase [Anaerolineales bacterium]|nr:phosphotransferase [Anaerolineales bacterium]
MAEKLLDIFPEERAVAVLERIVPGSSLAKIELLPGSFSNHTHLVEASLPNGAVYKIVVRRYKVFGEYDRGEKANREFKTFELLNRHKVPAPEPLLLDVSGDVLGSPGIVAEFVEGHLKMDVPSDPMEWSRKLARTLAKIHSIPCSENEQSFLLNGNEQASWFLNYDSAPHYMQEYPGGADLWSEMRRRSSKLVTDGPSLLHIDYWSGNILWLENEISAVLDWEEASYGDPAVDVGYALMNIVLMDAPDAADEFLSVYEAEMGRQIKNLVFWELAASVRPMTDPVDWNVHETGSNKDVLLEFIENAKRRAE